MHNILTGVISGNSEHIDFLSWYEQTDYIDMYYEMRYNEVRNAYIHEQRQRIKEEVLLKNPNLDNESLNKEIDQRAELEDVDEQATELAAKECEDFSGDVHLYGGWVHLDDNTFEPDTNSLYSAIVNNNVNTIQVVHSKFMVMDARMCSPCYPNQGDLDSEGGGVCCYCLPPVYLNTKSTLKVVATNFYSTLIYEKLTDEFIGKLDHLLAVRCISLGVCPVDYVPYSVRLEQMYSAADKEHNHYSVFYRLVNTEGVTITVTYDMVEGAMPKKLVRLVLDTDVRVEL